MSNPKRSKPTRARSQRTPQRMDAGAAQQHSDRAARAPGHAYAAVAAPMGGVRGVLAPEGATGVRVASGHTADKRPPHARRAASAAAQHGRRPNASARQSRPNVADLPRSASAAAIEAALRRRAIAASQPLPTRSVGPSATVSASRSVTVFRRSQAAPALRTLTAIAAAPAHVATQRLASVATQRLASVATLPRQLTATLPRVRVSRISRAQVLTLTLLVAILLALIPAPALAYNNTMALAKDGVTHLKNAENDFKTLATSPTNLTIINDAQSELQRAHNDFAQLQVRVGLLSAASGLPRVGAKISGANKLVPLAVEGTQAGVLACDALKTLVTGLKNPLGATGGLTSADLNQVISDVDQVHALYGQMAPQLQSLTQADLSLDPGLWPTVSGLQAKLPQATQLVNDLDGMAHVLPLLLGVGKPSTYLVEVLDSSELRPTGGFIGNFGALTLDSGRLNPGFHISDITLIDSSVKFPTAPNRQFIPIPSKYSWLNAVFVDPNGNSWSLRDSNLDPNYPTAAQYALQLYPRLLPDAQKNLAAQHSTLQLYNPAKSGEFAGVITLSLGFFAQALSVTGPIYTPQFHQTVTADNFVSKIHSYALGAHATGPDNRACGVTSCGKIFTSDVVQAFMAKVKSNLPLYVGKLGKLLFDSLRTKDVEVYFTAPQAQQMLHDLKLSAEVAAPMTGDSVYEVEANIGANKDNYFLQYQMADQITLDPSGAATHRLQWSYGWPRNPATLNETFAAGSPDYRSYARVFTPPQAKLISQQNLAGFGAGSEFQRNVFHGSVDVGYGQTARYGLAWKVPGVVTYDSTGYHYHLIFQREAGITWPLKVSITLPACAMLTGAPVTSGLTAQNSVMVQGNTVTITGPLTMDAQAQINYTYLCSPSAPALHSPAFITSKPLRARHWQTVAARLGQNDQPRKRR